MNGERTRKGLGERPGNTGEISEGSEKRNNLSQREKKESEKWRGSREGTSRLVTYTYYGPDIKNFKTCKRIIIDFVVDRE